MDHSILLLSLLCWRLATDSCHGLVVAPTDEQHLTSEASPSTRRHRALEQSAASSAHAGPQENRSPWEMEAACGTAERGTFSRRRWCLNGISASPPPALVPGRIGQSATCPCANVLPFVLFGHPCVILAPYRQMSTLLQQRHSQPHACPPRIGRCAFEARAARREVVVAV